MHREHDGGDPERPTPQLRSRVMLSAVASERLRDLFALCDVNYGQRLEMEAAPALALELLEYAITRPKITNPAAFAVSRFRREMGRRQRSEEAHAPSEEERAPTLSGLEYAWHLDAPPFVLDAMAAAIAEHGGFVLLLMRDKLAEVHAA